MKTQLFKPQAKSNWYRIENSTGSDSVEILIYDEIGGYGINAEVLVSELQKINSKTINVRLNTPGGSVFDGIAIYNALRQHPAQIVVDIDGLAASIGSIIALAGDTVRMAKNAYFMIHNPWVLTVGDADELRKTANLLDKISGTLTQTYVDKTGHNNQKISKWMADETWFTAEEALSTGFIDEISGTSEARASFDLSIYNHAPKKLTADDMSIVESIRDFEAALREELGFSHRESRRIASGGWPAFVRDEQIEGEEAEAAQFISKLCQDLKV